MKISLKGKIGENPTLSRNCEFGASHINATVKMGRHDKR